MPNNLHDDALKAAWQKQPTETSAMSLILIRQKARALRAKTRRQMLGTLTVPLVIVFFYVFCIKQFPNVREMVHALFAFALAWSIAGLYFLNRGGRSGEMPGDAGFTMGLEFCRREIERILYYFHRDLLWAFGPVLLAIATLLTVLAVTAGTTFFLSAMPLMTVVVLWIAAYLLIRARQQRAFRRERDELNGIENENGG